MLEEFGTRNPAEGIDRAGITEAAVVRYNLREAELVELAVSAARPG